MALLILLFQIILGVLATVFYVNGILIPFYIIGAISFIFFIFYAAANGRLYGMWNYPILFGLFIICAVYLAIQFDMSFITLMLFTCAVIVPIYKAIFLVVYQIIVRRNKEE